MSVAGKDSTYVPIHKFKGTERYSDKDGESKSKSLGVCLWGPPGCGKSSGFAHVKNILEVEKLILFNSDDFTEFLVTTFFMKTYSQLCKEKHHVYADAPHLIKDFAEKELNFKNSVRDSKFDALCVMAHNYGEISVEMIPESLYMLLNNYMVSKFGEYIDESQWDEFNAFWLSARRVRFEDFLNPGAALYEFGPWWARKNDKSFVLETTGRTWNEKFHKWAFDGIHNLLYIPFVHDLAALCKRVEARQDQFGNPSPDFVKDVFNAAYGKNLISAIDSKLYDQIIVQGNGNVNYIMMSLERFNTGDVNGYVLVKEFASDIKEAIYIQALLHAMYIPSHMHDANTLIYDVDSKTWKSH
jgi:hypothetical protein